MKREKKKHPSDYPQMAYRVSEQDKLDLQNLIDEIHFLANSKIKENELKIKKNEIIVIALKIGLSTLRKKY